ncbi:MAG TPA: PhoU domain-containing protein, partial [Candidatus Saccharimonadales bacterium]|nr:PhoU domain-containing protein [Candidatus Saccharimonadales bacterium]
NTVSPPPELGALADIASDMLRRALDTLGQGDAEGARHVCADDGQADQLEDRVLEKLQERMIAEPASVPARVQFILVARNLERVADLATNVAEEAIFVAQARVIKHHREDPV